MSVSPEKSAFELRLAEAAASVEAALRELLSPEPLAGEIERPPRLVAAMRHAVLAGGKRFRPFLLIESARLFGVGPAHAGTAAAAVECLHTYSLIHDDLPAMDDDDFRRGLSTVHKAFDEATAILAGDALLTLAFEVLTRPETHRDPAVRTQLVQVLARSAGLGGMAGGQMLDLLAEGMAQDEGSVSKLQSMKTGALISASCEMGGILGGAAPDARSALRRFGRALGKAFQIADDLLDVESSVEALGKGIAKDAGRGKATFLSLLGVDGARMLLAESVEQCEIHLTLLPGDVSILRQAAHFAASRMR